MIHTQSLFSNCVDSQKITRVILPSVVYWLPVWPFHTKALGATGRALELRKLKKDKKLTLLRNLGTKKFFSIKEALKELHTTVLID